MPSLPLFLHNLKGVIYMTQEAKNEMLAYQKDVLKIALKKAMGMTIKTEEVIELKRRGDALLKKYPEIHLFMGN